MKAVLELIPKKTLIQGCDAHWHVLFLGNLWPELPFGKNKPFIRITHGDDVGFRQRCSAWSCIGIALLWCGFVLTLTMRTCRLLAGGIVLTIATRRGTSELHCASEWTHRLLVCRTWNFKQRPLPLVFARRVYRHGILVFTGASELRGRTWRRNERLWDMIEPWQSADEGRTALLANSPIKEKIMGLPRYLQWTRPAKWHHQKVRLKTSEDVGDDICTLFRTLWSRDVAREKTFL